MLKCDVVLKH